MQYTLRNIPEKVDHALRKKAKEQGRSLNEVALEALAIVSGVHEPAERIKRRDLSDLAGTWVEDPAFDAAIKEMDQIDPELWR
jgi:plasmid stability protein